MFVANLLFLTLVTDIHISFPHVIVDSSIGAVSIPSQTITTTIIYEEEKEYLFLSSFSHVINKLVSDDERVVCKSHTV